jgi:hypothetical protein
MVCEIKKAKKELFLVIRINIMDFFDFPHISLGGIRRKLVEWKILSLFLIILTFRFHWGDDLRYSRLLGFLDEYFSFGLGHSF